MMAVSPAAAVTVISPVLATKVHVVASFVMFSSACWNGSSEDATGAEEVEALQPASENSIKQLKGTNDKRLRMKNLTSSCGPVATCDANSRSTGLDEREP